MASFELVKSLKERANALGFDTCKITSASLPKYKGENLAQFVSEKRHGTMQWMETTLERRKTPTAMWQQAKSAIVLGMNYGPEVDPLANLLNNEAATVSVYARNRDYHDIIKGKLKTLAGWVTSKTKSDVKVFVDTAPLMEKPLAEQAGLGWQGKHTNLVSRELGSWIFLGSILTTAELEPDMSERDHCGSCQSCLDICPTNAFPAPYQLDARRCISYLTIEHAGPIPIEFRKAMGNRIYGCDDCLAVCPWNKYAQSGKEARLKARDDLLEPSLQELAKLDDVAFRRFFSGSPIKRIGRDRFMRNVLIAIGNSGSKALLHSAKTLLDDKNPLVRGAAVWAISNLESPSALSDIRSAYLKTETDPDVISEWTSNEL